MTMNTLWIVVIASYALLFCDVRPIGCHFLSYDVVITASQSQHDLPLSARVHQPFVFGRGPTGNGNGEPDWNLKTSVTYMAAATTACKAFISNEHWSIISRRWEIVEGRTLESLLSPNKSRILALPLFHEISQKLNYCAATVTNNAKTADSQFELRSLLWNFAIAMWPWNTLAIKNYSFFLECYGYYASAKALYIDCIFSLNDPGCRFQHAFVSNQPFAITSESEALMDYFTVLYDTYFSLFIDIPISNTVRDSSGHAFNDPIIAIRDLQLNQQYIGYSPSLISIAYNLYVKHVFPVLNQNYQNLHITRRHRNSESSILVGIVTADYRNSSPGLCFMRIIAYLHTHYRSQIELVFLDRESGSAMSWFIRGLGIPVVLLSPDDVSGSQVQILNLQLDILLYLALPTEKFTTILSHSRLAPIQIQFGVGHPITSGNAATIDYSIVARDMLLNHEAVITKFDLVQMSQQDSVQWYMDESLRNVDTRIAKLSREEQWAWHCMRASHQSLALCQTDTDRLSVNSSTWDCVTETLPQFCKDDSHLSAIVYAEQLVLFESPAYFLEDSLQLLDDPFDPLDFISHITCEELETYLQKWNIHPHMTAESMGCQYNHILNARSDHAAIESWRLKRTHIYSCIQIQKKLHQRFDSVLVGIITRDKRSKIIMLQSAKAILQRISLNFNLTMDELQTHFVFINRLPHSDYLRLLSFSDVFLTTFPFGAGITSSDAISVSVPLVVYPPGVNVLSISYQQIIELGRHEESLPIRDMLADSISDYVDKAVAFAHANDDISICDAENVPSSPISLRIYSAGWKLKLAMNSSKVSYFGDTQAHKVAEEWSSFLRRISLV